MSNYSQIEFANCSETIFKIANQVYTKASIDLGVKDLRISIDRASYSKSDLDRSMWRLDCVWNFHQDKRLVRRLSKAFSYLDLINAFADPMLIEFESERIVNIIKNSTIADRSNEFTEST